MNVLILGTNSKKVGKICQQFSAISERMECDVHYSLTGLAERVKTNWPELVILVWNSRLGFKALDVIFEHAADAVVFLHGEDYPSLFTRDLPSGDIIPVLTADRWNELKAHPPSAAIAI